MTGWGSDIVAYEMETIEPTGDMVRDYELLSADEWLSIYGEELSIEDLI